MPFYAHKKAEKIMSEKVLRGEEFVTIEEVHQAYMDCRKKKWHSKQAVQYVLDYELNNLELWRELNNGTYTIAPSRAFCVTRPKLREVFCAMFRDRIVHHILANKFLPLIEAELTPCAFACRKGKGVEYGVQRAAYAMQSVSENYTKEAYVLKCDMEGFFMSIDRHLLYGKLERLIRDKHQGTHTDRWLSLWRQVILNKPEENCTRGGDLSLWDKLPKSKSLFTSNGKGLPIGNLPSQILANFLLSDFDKWVISEVGEAYYGRYVDDFFIVSTNKAHLLRLLSEARERLKALGLRLHPKKIYLQPVRHGMEFTGAVIKPYGILAGTRLKRNIEALIRKWNEDPAPDTPHYVRRANSYLGFLAHRKSYAQRWMIWRNLHSIDKHKIISVRHQKFNVKHKYL